MCYISRRFIYLLTEHLQLIYSPSSGKIFWYLWCEMASVRHAIPYHTALVLISYWKMPIIDSFDVHYSKICWKLRERYICRFLCLYFDRCCSISWNFWNISWNISGQKNHEIIHIHTGRLERLLWASLTVARGPSQQSRGWRVFMIFFWFSVLFSLSDDVFVSPTWYSRWYSWHDWIVCPTVQRCRMLRIIRMTRI